MERLEKKEAISDSVESVLQNTLSFIEEIAADCFDVSSSPGIERAESRTWVSVAKRCKAFVERQEALLLSLEGISSPAASVSSQDQAPLSHGSLTGFNKPSHYHEHLTPGTGCFVEGCNYIAPSVESEGLVNEQTQLLGKPDASAESVQTVLQNALRELDVEYRRQRQEYDDEAKRLASRGDAHGQNFYQGKSSGMVSLDIALTPLKRIVEGLKAFSVSPGVSSLEKEEKDL